MSTEQVKIYSPFAGFQERFVCSDVDFLVGGSAMGVGKEQPLNAKILTPKGWVRMGDLRIGDSVITPFDGVAPITGIYPQGRKPVYKLTTADGRACECGLEHLWDVRTKSGLLSYKRNKEWTCGLQTLTTKELMRLMSKTREVCVPIYTRDHVRIKSIEYVREDECQCIYIDSPKHLYITDDYIVTHNSVGALLMAAEPSSDPNFRMLFLRRNLGDLKAGGGGLDEAVKIYGPFCKVRMADSPRLTFPSGAFIDFTHMDNQNEDDVLERVKGWQYSVIYVDEATGFEWSTIRLLMSRNRSQAKWTGKMRLTCNPKRNHWLRVWVDWYLDEQGYPIPERVGVVRYFFVNGEKIEDVVFGDTPEEVYQKCRPAIDRLLRAMKDDNLTYRDFIKTTTFYTGKLSENKALDQSYIGSVAAMGEKQRQANMEACWNVDLDDDLELPISSAAARALPENDECRNGEKWLTCDLATSGKDNAVFVVWDGLHIEYVEVHQRTTPRQNVRIMSSIANRYDVPTSHIIYDATGAQYVADDLPDAIAFWSSSAPRGKFRRDFDKLKDECYKRLVEVINCHNISMSKRVAEMDYVRMKTTTRNSTNLMNEFAEECSVVQFQQLASGKIKLYGKKEMNSKLGKSRSMDLLDPCAMRMRPLLDCVYGEELAAQTQEEHLTEENSDRYISIFDEW